MADVYDAYVVQEYTTNAGEVKRAWNKVGVAFMNADGEGFNLDVIPGISISGSITIRKRKAKPECEPPQNIPQPPNNYMP